MPCSSKDLSVNRNKKTAAIPGGRFCFQNLFSINRMVDRKTFKESEPYTFSFDPNPLKMVAEINRKDRYDDQNQSDHFKCFD